MLTATGIGSVVLGGLVAAVTEPLDLTHGSWVAAYLVLVGGVGQGAMGRARLRRPDVRPAALLSAVRGPGPGAAGCVMLPSHVQVDAE